MTFLLGSREIASADLDVYSEKSPLGSAILAPKLAIRSTTKLQAKRYSS